MLIAPDPQTRPQPGLVSPSPSATTSMRPSVVAFAATALLICTNGPSTFAALHWFDEPLNSRSWPFLYPFGVVAGVATALLARHAWRARSDPFPWPILPIAAFVAWSIASTEWSVAPDATRTFAVTSIGIAALGCWFGWALTFREQVWSVAIATTTAVALSAIVIAIAPVQGRMPVPYVGVGGEWRGIFGNRNSLAPVALLGVLAVAGVVALRPSWRRLIVAAPFVVLHAVVMVGAESNTAYFALALSLAVGVTARVLWSVRWHGVDGRLVAALGTVAAVVATYVVMRNLSTLSLGSGRNSSLSGRRLIWADMRDLIADRPIRGYGLGALWERSDLTAATYARLGGPYGSAHNSPLEVLLGLGAIGFVAYLWIALLAVIGTLVWSWQRPSVAALWWVVLVALLGAFNLMESFVLWHSYSWVLLIAAAFAPFNPAATGVSGESPRRGGLERLGTPMISGWQ